MLNLQRLDNDVVDADNDCQQQNQHQHFPHVFTLHRLQKQHSIVYTRMYKLKIIHANLAVARVCAFALEALSKRKSFHVGECLHRRRR